MSQPDAIAYCESLTLAGASWHLPAIDEWLALAKGCDGTTSEGTPKDEDFQSTCEWDGNTDFLDCQSCPVGEGPGNGCYWPAGMGQCLSSYWSSTYTLPLYFSPTSNYAYFTGTDTTLAFRCATDKP